jgi:hypothetical protein
MRTNGMALRQVMTRGTRSGNTRPWVRTATKPTMAKNNPIFT